MSNKVKITPGIDISQEDFLRIVNNQRVGITLAESLCSYKNTYKIYTGPQTRRLPELWDQIEVVDEVVAGERKVSVVISLLQKVEESSKKMDSSGWAVSFQTKNGTVNFSITNSLAHEALKSQDSAIVHLLTESQNWDTEHVKHNKATASGFLMEQMESTMPHVFSQIKSDFEAREISKALGAKDATPLVQNASRINNAHTNTAVQPKARRLSI